MSRLPGLPQPVRRAATPLLATVRRRAVRVLERAGRVPVIRPVAALGMRTLFDGLAPAWEKIRSDPAYEAAFVDALDRLPARFAPATALDVACGTGMAARLVLQRWPSARVEGCDISPRMVELAGAQLPAATFTVAESRRLPYGAGSFDLVATHDGVFDLSELQRVVAPGGFVVASYSSSGTTPVSRPLDELARGFAPGWSVELHRDGPGHVLVAGRPRGRR